MIDYLWAGKPAHFSVYEVGELMKELFSNLEAQYGEDFNWFLIPESKTSFTAEAYREIHVSHSLFGLKLRSIAKCEANDDVLFLCETDTNITYYVIHLTYNQHNDGDFPMFVHLKDLNDVRKYIESGIDI